MALLFGATLWFVLSTILWTGESVNDIALERQRAQLRGAIERHVGALREHVTEAASIVGASVGQKTDGPADDVAAVLGGLASLRDFDSVVMLSADGLPLGGLVGRAPVTPESFAAIRPLVEPALTAALALPGVADPIGKDGSSRPQGAAVTRVAFSGREPYAAVVAPVGIAWNRAAGGHPTAFLVGHAVLSLERLRTIAALHDLGGVSITTVRPDEPKLALALAGPSGETAAYLTWTPDRPGDVMRDRLLVPTSLGFCVVILLFGLVAAYLHWLARDLAAMQARSRALLGHDPLSGLANRVLFGEKLDAQLETLGRSGGSLAVLFVDLDRFKDVNDSYGHAAGDDLIRLVAQRLINVVRAGDTIARFGGDEFAIMQTGDATQTSAAQLARRILEALRQPFMIGDTAVSIGASVGISLAPYHATGREALISLADTALYQAKSEGRNRFSFFQSRMDETIRLRKVVEDDLRRGILRDELILHYQPLYASDGATIVGLEALVRWQHPVRGLISPGDFIPIAEECGLVIPLGEWVLRRACLDGKRWPGLRIAVNVSPIQFRHRDFVPRVKSLLAETGFEPARLELELTEGVVVDDADSAETAMKDLRAMGVHLALDDFGTGYSSLIYLRRFAFDTIKIDRSFLDRMEATGESAILVHSMVHLGRALGLTVTAEGVETTEQHRFLQALGCHQLQGFLFSRPVPAEEIDSMLGLGPRAVAAA